MNAFYNYGVDLALADAGLIKTAADTDRVSRILEYIKTDPRLHRGLAGGAGGAALGALLGGAERRGLGALIGGGLGAAGGAFAPEIIEGVSAVPSKARRLINDLVGTGT